MKIYFVYRSPYHNPNCKYLKIFEASSILAWFQENWDKIEDPSFLGQEIYGLNDWKRLEKYPNSYEELFKEIDKKCYTNRTEFSEHCIQVQTDDDEIHLAWYIFDEIFKNEHKKQLTAYLMYESYQLPLQFAKYSTFYTDLPVETYTFSVENYVNTYIITNGIPFDFHYDCEFDLRYPPLKIKGITASQLLDFLQNHDIDKQQFTDLSDLKYLLSFFPREHFWNLLAHLDLLRRKYEHHPAPDESKDRNEIMKELIENVIHGTLEQSNEYLNKFGNWDDFHKNLDTIIQNLPISPYLIVTEHLIQVSIEDGDTYYYWLIFDDYWASANPDLAKAILRYRYKWNCLSD